MNKEKVSKLKQMVDTEKDLSNIFNYFMDHFGENPSVLTQSETYKIEENPILETVLTQTIERITQSKSPPVYMLQVYANALVHGMIIKDGNFIALMYFDVLKKGVFGIASINKMDYYRFLTMHVESDLSEKTVVAGNQTLN